jgi:hypothetical protein
VSSPVFERVSEVLEKRTGMSRLESRGTIRIALKEAGLESSHVNREQMLVVIDKVLPQELLDRGVDDADAVCEFIERLVKSEVPDGRADSAGDRIDGLFRRTL